VRFLSGERLWFLLVVVALVAAYFAMQGRRRRDAVRFTNVELLASVAPRRPGWRRHVPAAALVAALCLLVIGFARPTRAVKVPREQATVMLAIDVSASMEATDVDPSRFVAAREAARAFTERLPARFRLGLLEFAGTATVLVPPTNDRRPVLDSLDNLRLGPRTAIGEAIFAALDTISSSTDATSGQPGQTGRKPPPARIVLLSDGATTAGRPNETAADAAAEARVPVSTIAFGTDAGTVVVDGRLVEVPVDRDALREVADITRGSFFEAESGEELRHVYDDIGSQIGFRTEHREVSAWFVGVALGFAFAAAAGSLLWSARLP
jgi:Ca-activated chloride channel family protein